MAVVFVPGRIALARESRGLTLAQVAEKVEASSQQVSEWELGKVTPRADKVATLLSVLEVPATFFFVDSGANGAHDVHQTKEGRTE